MARRYEAAGFDSQAINLRPGQATDQLSLQFPYLVAEPNYRSEAANSRRAAAGTLSVTPSRLAVSRTTRSDYLNACE